MERIYVDHNATTPPAPQVVAAMTEILEEQWGNPSSIHRFGQSVRQRVELARSKVAGLIGARDRELIFTSGGTESNNLVLRSALTADRLRSRTSPAVIITSPIEHASIEKPVEDLKEAGAHVVQLGVDASGRVAPDELAAVLRDHGSRGAWIFVTIQWANNETGVLQSIEELVEVCRYETRKSPACRILFHTDATQAVGKIPVDVKACGVDFLTCSAHKFHGPKGIGTLYARTGARLRWRQFGGSQERDRRGGTENVAGIVGMGTAAELAGAFVADRDAAKGAEVRRDRFEDHMVRVLPGSVVHAHAAPRLWNTTNIGFANVAAEAILIALSEKGVCASAGAACSSGSLEPSPILLAMGIPESLAHGSVRFSLSRFTDDDEIDQAIQIVPSIVQRLARILPLGADDR